MYLEVENGEVQFKGVSHLGPLYSTTSPGNHLIFHFIFDLALIDIFSKYYISK